MDFLTGGKPGFTLVGVVNEFLNYGFCLPYLNAFFFKSTLLLDCVLWAGNVFLVGDTLRNLDSAVGDADDILCKICNKAGATIGCLKRGCPQTSHYPCAVLNGWNLNENTYHSYCRSHTDMASDSSKQTCQASS